MNKSRLVVPAILLIVVGLVLGGCGGGKTSEKRLSKKEFVAKANKICTDFEAEQKKLGEPQNMADLSKLLDKAIPTYKKVVSDLEGLNPPEADDATYKQIVDLLHEQTGYIEQIAKAVKDNDLTKAQEIMAKGNKIDDKVDSLFTKIGVAECAND